MRQIILRKQVAAVDNNYQPITFQNAPAADDHIHWLR